MTLSVRFYLSYDSLKWDFIICKMSSISIKKCIVNMVIGSGVTCMGQTVNSSAVFKENVEVLS